MTSSNYVPRLESLSLVQLLNCENRDMRNIKLTILNQFSIIFPLVFIQYGVGYADQSSIHHAVIDKQFLDEEKRVHDLHCFGNWCLCEEETEVPKGEQKVTQQRGIRTVKWGLKDVHNAKCHRGYIIAKPSSVDF